MSGPRQRHVGRVQIALILVTGVAVGGCATGRAAPVWHTPAPARATVAAPAGSSVERGQAVSERANPPLLAQREWAVEIPPAERPIRFNRWRQRW